MVMFLTGFSQEQNKTVETADDLLVKFIEYWDKSDAATAIDFLKRAFELDPTKVVYMEILRYILLDGKYDEALKLLEKRKDQSPEEKELKVIQILAAETHFRWAEELEKKYDYINAIKHLESAYVIDTIYRYIKSAVHLKNIGFLYAAIGKKQNR